MADDIGNTEELSKSSLDLGRAPRSDVAILRCVDTSVLRGPGGREIKLTTSEISVGRGTENSVCIDGTGMSRVHARIFFAAGDWHVEDLGSTNGTRVNNSNVETATLTDGDTVAFGRVCYKFIKLDPVGTPRTLDLGMDQTLVLAPNERPGTNSLADTEPAGRAVPRASAVRHRPASTPVQGSAGLGIWLILVLLGLVAVIAALVLLD